MNLTKAGKPGMPKLQERDQALILIALGLVGVALAYVFGYQNFTEKTDTLNATNSTMRQQVTLLQSLTDNRVKYETDTSQYMDDAQEILATFPVDLFEEDLVLYAKHLDDLEDETFIGAIATPRREPVGIGVPAREDELVSANDITGQIAANAYQNDGSVLDVSGAVLNESVGSLSLKTSYNGFKNLVIDLIGWVRGEDLNEDNTIIEDADTPGAEAPTVAEPPADAEAPTVAEPPTVADPSTVAEPVEATDEMGLEATGEDIIINKTKVVAQRRINQIDLSFDEETGEYMSMVSVSFFALEGMDREYIKPDPGIEDHGINNVFGSNLSNGTLLPPLSDLDPNYIPPQPGEVFGRVINAEEEGTEATPAEGEEVTDTATEEGTATTP